MNAIALKIRVQDNYREALIAELIEMEFNGFEELEDTIIAYIELQWFNDVNREYLELFLSQYPGDNFIESEEQIEEKNWNREWEESIKPIEIGRFWVQPTWYNKQPPEGKMVLYVDPKMAFGTGYHETTRLLLRALSYVWEDKENEIKQVLDVGTGTGILAIASIKLGAKEVLGLDIDPWSIQNATENVHLNNVSDKVSIKEGSTELLANDEQFDVVIANINRNTIADLSADLVSHLDQSEGDLLLSGLLEKDVAFIKNIPQLRGLTCRRYWQEGEWVALWFTTVH